MTKIKKTLFILWTIACATSFVLCIALALRIKIILPIVLAALLPNLIFLPYLMLRLSPSKEPLKNTSQEQKR